MKPITIALLTLLAGLGTTAAKADHSRVNVGIGVTFGSSYPTPAPIYVPAPVVVSAPRHGYNYSPARGHWENVTVKTWIPGRWVTSRDRWGRTVRFFEEGRFAFRTERVWVDHSRRPAYSYGRDHWNR